MLKLSLNDWSLEPDWTSLEELLWHHLVYLRLYAMLFSHFTPSVGSHDIACVFLDAGVLQHGSREAN